MLIYSTIAKIRSKWIIGRTKWILEYFPYLALVEYRTKWIRIKWAPGVCLYTRNQALRTVWCQTIDKNSRYGGWKLWLISFINRWTFRLLFISLCKQNWHSGMNRTLSLQLLHGVRPLAGSMEVKNNHAHVTTPIILYKFIEVNFSVGCMVWPWCCQFQDLTTMSLINKNHHKTT